MSPSLRASSSPRPLLVSSKPIRGIAIPRDLGSATQDTLTAASHQFLDSRGCSASSTTKDITIGEDFMDLDKQLNPSSAVFVGADPPRTLHVLGCLLSQVSLRSCPASSFRSTRSSHALSLRILRLLSTAFVDANPVASQHASPSASKENQPTTLQVTDHDCALSHSLEGFHNNSKQYPTSTSGSVSSSCSILLSCHILPCSLPFPPSRHSRSCLPTRDGCYLSVPRRCPASFRCGARSVVLYSLEPRTHAIKNANVTTQRAPS